MIERRHWYLIAATSMASFVLSSAITYNTFKFMCENYRLEKVSDDKSLNTQSDASDNKEFDCYIEEIKNLARNSFPENLPVDGKTSFKCGNNKYLILLFNEYGSERALGGLLPVTKTMHDLGCNNVANKIICREEKIVSVKGINYLPYREMVLSKINDEDMYFLENESTKPQVVKPVEPEVQPETEPKTERVKVKRRF